MAKVESGLALEKLWELGVKSIQELETERGILASGRHEVYGCIFGRDSLITSLALLRVYENTKNEYFLSLVRKVLSNLAELQGREVNIESGEEPGKCIHEFRPSDHEHLTGLSEWAWYLYPDNIMRNYDSVDSTPLFLMTIHEYYRLSNDGAFVQELLPNIHAGLQWIKEFGDTNNDGFIDYRFHADRTHGGLKTQSWMDSTESLFHEDESPALYPIAPVEVQAYTFVVLKAWSNYFKEKDPLLSDELSRQALTLKQNFNQKFVVKTGKHIKLAFALDGNGRPLTSARSSMGHVLWAVSKEEGNEPESILDSQYIPQIVDRLMCRDLFVPYAGMRTLSSRSKHFDAGSYHNGSVWPHDTAIVAEGLQNFGYGNEARRVREALIYAYKHFKSPIELFVYSKGRYREYLDPRGQGACRTQAWSAASLLSTLGGLEFSSPNLL